ncbi:MAG: Ku protein [Candidatus Kapaibacterium sp.]
MNPVWKGGISFGLVYLPVKLYSGTEQHKVPLDMIREGDKCPIKYVRVCRDDGEEVPWEKIIKGYKTDGHYVELKDEDFEKIDMKRSQNIEIIDFVSIDEISPRYFTKPYLVEPDKESYKVYNLLREAIHKSGKVGITKFVMRSREILAVLMADEKVLYINQLRFSDEVRSADKLDIPEEKKPKKEELDLALKIIEGMNDIFHPDKYKDTYREKLMEIIEAKKEDRKPETPKPKNKRKTKEEDLLKKLKQSLDMVN